jgi:MscS family membrane protein
MRPSHIVGIGLSIAVLAAASANGEAKREKYPLEPAVTTSPRETLQTFLKANKAMWTIIRDEGMGRRSGEGYQKVQQWDDEATRTLDLSQVPPEARDQTADVALVHLYEVLTRIHLPPLTQVPDDAAISADPTLDRWTIPHTEITIHRVAAGPRKGEFLFTPETVDRAEEFFERIKSMPYRIKPPIANMSAFLRVYGGWQIPVTWIDALPESMRRVKWGQAVWKWLFLGAVGILVVALTWVVWWVTRGRERSKKRRWLELALPTFLLLVSLSVGSYVTELILITGTVAKALSLIGTAVAYLSLAWITWILIIAAGDLIVGSPRIHAESLDASLIRLTARLVAIGVAVALIFQGASQVGIPLMGLVASLSIGGLAIALAAQDTLKNLLGSLMIFMDKPYKVGERIVAGSHDGIVENIGLRSTRIRQLDGHLTSVPNEQMATMDIENVGRRPNIRRHSKLRLSTETPREKVAEAVEIVREILKDHEGMPPDKPARVYFEGFNPDSLSIVIFYWFAPPDYWAYCDFNERVNLEILKRFADAGIALAPPTSAMQITGTSDERQASHWLHPDEEH